MWQPNARGVAPGPDSDRYRELQRRSQSDWFGPTPDEYGRQPAAPALVQSDTADALAALAPEDDFADRLHELQRSIDQLRGSKPGPDRIGEVLAEATTERCSHCARPLQPNGPSEMFCDEACQRAWHSYRAADGARLPGYREPWDDPTYAPRETGGLHELDREPTTDELLDDLPRPAVRAVAVLASSQPMARSYPAVELQLDGNVSLVDEIQPDGSVYVRYRYELNGVVFEGSWTPTQLRWLSHGAVWRDL